MKFLIHRPAFELGVLLAATLAYCSMFLKFGVEWRLPGNEAELFQSFGLIFYQSLVEGSSFPLWNPFIRSGLPFVADPMLYIYNPLVSIPILLFGPWDGFKLALLVHFLLAGLGMRRLCQTLGISSPVVRLWVALLYVFAGQPAARFFQGEYLFVFGFAWIPWIVHHLLQVARTPRWPKIAWAALSLAMLYFCGNAYYPFLMLFVVALFLLVMVPVITWNKPAWKILPRLPRMPALRLPHLDWRQTRQRTVSYLLVGLLALGLIAILFIPQAEFWPRLSKGQGAFGSHNLGQILLDYTSKDPYRPDAFQDLPAREEFYAYIGWGPILALIFLPLAFLFRPRKPLLFLLLVLAFVVVYIDLKDMPWRDGYEKIRILSQFRHLLRPLIFGSFAILLLGGIGLDEIWQRLTTWSRGKGAKRVAAIVVLVVLGALMLWSVRDVYATNRPHLALQSSNLAVNRLANWLSDYDSSEYTVRFNPTNAALYAMLDAELRYSQVWYPLDNFITLEGTVTERLIPADPNYILQTAAEVAPQAPAAEMVHEQEGYKVYWLPDSLPLAFTVEQAELSLDAQTGPLMRAQVFPLVPFVPEYNQVEIVTDRPAGNVLVLLITYDPGWQVEIDGDLAAVINVGGYLGVDVQRGVHKYTFAYRPPSFFIGLVITLLASGFIVARSYPALRLLFRNLREHWQAWTLILQQRRSRLQAWWQAQQPQSRLAEYQGGVLKLESPLALAEQTQVRVTVAERVGGLPDLTQALQQWLLATTSMITTLIRTVSLPTMLFVLGLLVYLLTRLNGLSDWPIYFFTDEAVQTVMAEDFLHNGLTNSNGEFLPTYFSKDATYNLSSLSVYLQVIPYLLFGKSVFVTRAVSVLVATFGAVMVGLTLRDIFKLRYWWSGVLLLSVIPAWFLHSRTAFETVEMTAFYAAFLYFYLRYRTLNPRALYAALVFGAMVFYTYSPGQFIIVVSGIFLLLSDLRYHWQQRRVALRGLILLAVLVLPFLRYYLAHPLAPLQHLTTRAPYWLENIPFIEKLAHYFGQYLAALDPRYWFLPNQHDLDRHLMLGYGHISLWMLPLLVIGLGICLFKLRSPAHRAVLLALLAAPSGSALVEVGITRLLVLVVPATILVALGLNQALEWYWMMVTGLVKRVRQGRPPLEKSLLRAQTAMVLALALILGGLNLAMLRDARVNGPRWFQDYTLGGMQYGARQVFTAVVDYYQKNPSVKLLVSPSWTNGADAVAEFFLPAGAPVTLGSVEGHIFQHLPLDDDMVFVVIPSELDKLNTSGKFEHVRIEQIIEYPNGEPGFYFIRMRYAADIDRILEVEREARRALLETSLEIAGQPVRVRYPVLDMGDIVLVFDGDANTLARTLEANPFIIELTFPAPRPVSGAVLHLGSAYLQVRVSLSTSSAEKPIVFETMFQGSVAQPELKLDFNGEITTQQMRFEILAPGIAEPANIHIWEISITE